MKKISCFTLLLAVGLTTLARADGSQNDYLNAAQQIYASLQSAVTHPSPSEMADLALLNSRSDVQAEQDQEKSPDSTMSQENAAAEQRLAADFASQFQQPDNIDYPDYKPGIPFEEPRDVYTFCPPGSEVERPLSTTQPLDATSQDAIEYVWGWSHCQPGPDWTSQAAPEAIRIQQIWVYNVKLGHPSVSLLIIEDAQPGTKILLQVDINQLAAGKVSVSDLLKTIAPH